MGQVYWLRAETKENEFRRALTPDSCEKLINAGHTVHVEDWTDSIIPTEDYKKIGCKVETSGSWISAPKEAIIVGLKALPDNNDDLIHTHIFFAHAYKEQDGWKEILTRFEKGNGRIIDLEYMVNDQGRRVCAFGFWAGFVGAALGALFAKTNNKDAAQTELTKLKQFGDKEDLIDFVKKHTNNAHAKAMIIGASGRSGSGANDLFNSLSWEVTGWDRKETEVGGPFKEILGYDVFVNCVLALSKMPPFINRELLDANKSRELKVISDVSCDPDSDCNMIPLYDKATKLESALYPVSGEDDLSIMAIDNLPSILPKESSFDFSSQLEAYLINYTESAGPIKNALDSFNDAFVRMKA